MSNSYFMVTGASSGIGASCCDYLAKGNNKLLLIGRDEQRLSEVTQRLPGIGHIFKVVDMEEESQVIALVKELKNNDIKLDGLVCSAGTHQVKPLRICKQKDYLDLFSTNVLTVTNILSRVTKILNPGSGIVLLGSAGINRGASAVSTYAVAKAALNGLMRAAALEMSPAGVRVNVVAPGVVKTAMTESFLASIGDDAKEEVIGRHPLGLGHPSDVAGLIGYLLSAEARWITGQTIVIDGGFSIAG
jgi:NAD(P)-dependent dehydrogenase (short-subunit alcohol dehydrogenase family)